jgi:hypothetical protein
MNVIALQYFESIRMPTNIKCAAFQASEQMKYLALVHNFYADVTKNSASFLSPKVPGLQIRRVKYQWLFLCLPMGTREILRTFLLLDNLYIALPMNFCKLGTILYMFQTRIGNFQHILC